MGRRNFVLPQALGLLLLASLAVAAPVLAQSRDAYRRVQTAPPREQSRRTDGDRAAAARNTLNAFIQSLMQVDPEQRRELLANNRRFQRLPAAQRRAIQSRLDEFDKLPADRRELLLQRYELFSRLRQNQQSEARALFRDWNRLPRERRNRVTLAVRRLRNASPEDRRQALTSERFANLYVEEDQRLIERLLNLEPQSEGASAEASDEER